MSGRAVVPAQDVTEVRYQMEYLSAEATKRIKDKERELRRLEDENRQLNEMLREQVKRSSSSLSDRKSRVSELNARLVRVQRELENIEGTRARLNASLETSIDEKNALQRKLDAAQGVSAKLEAELKQSTSEASKLEARLRELEAELMNPVPRVHGESEGSRRLLGTLQEVRAEQDRLRGVLRDAKYDCDQKRAKLSILHNKLRAASEVLASRDLELRHAREQTQRVVDRALANDPGSSPEAVLKDNAAAVKAKEEQMDILAAKAAEADRVIDDLLAFVKSAGSRRFVDEDRAATAASVRPAPEPVNMRATAPAHRSPPTNNTQMRATVDTSGMVNQSRELEQFRASVAQQNEAHARETQPVYTEVQVQQQPQSRPAPAQQQHPGQQFRYTQGPPRGGMRGRGGAPMMRRSMPPMRGGGRGGYGVGYGGGPYM